MYKTVKLWMTERLLFEKLNNPLGYILFSLLALCCAYLMSILGIKFGIVSLAAAIGLPVLGACLINHQFGVSFILIISFFINYLGKFYDIPFGTSLDALIVVMFFGLLLKQILDRNFEFVKNPISILILVWILYNLTQFLNPLAASKLAWMYTVRSMAGLILLFFIASYAFDSLKKIIWSVKLMLGLALLAAVYSLKQEYIGFTDGEIAWLYADEERFQLIVQWTRFRVFSFFADPTTFGILMSFMGMFAFVLATGPFRNSIKIILVMSGVAMFMGMAYAGSRTPFVLIPFGFIVYMLMVMKKKVFLISLALMVVGVLGMMKSTSSAVIWRIQSAFNFKYSSDTMDVRFNNQKKIRPYIQQRPFGSGLGSTGLWGRRFTPKSFLASFAHDSGFVRIAVELGWIGLILYMLLLFSILKTCIYYYLRVRNSKIKVLYLALTVVMFMLTLASYPQEAILQLPNSIIFYVMLAIIVKLKDFDEYYVKNYQAKEKHNYMTEGLKF